MCRGSDQPLASLRIFLWRWLAKSRTKLRHCAATGLNTGCTKLPSLLPNRNNNADMMVNFGVATHSFNDRHSFSSFGVPGSKFQDPGFLCPVSCRSPAVCCLLLRLCVSAAYCCAAAASCFVLRRASRFVLRALCFVLCAFRCVFNPRIPGSYGFSGLWFFQVPKVYPVSQALHVVL